MILNALTIDVEEWFQVSTFSSVIKVSEWTDYESRVSDETLKVLEILDEYKTKATFFVLGYVAKKYPEVVKRIANRGHEVATHGYSHYLICDLTPDEFRDELLRSKDVIEQIIGQEVVGHRAPSFSITDDVRWAFDVMEEYGIKYDSSVLPGGIRFGISNAKRFPYNISKEGHLIEFPPSTVKFLGRLIPFSGGLFLRILPYAFIKSSIRKINNTGNPAMVYIHPWELDVNQPKLHISLRKRFIHYYNLASTGKKLRSLLADFRLGTVKNVLSLNNS